MNNIHNQIEEAKEMFQSLDHLISDETRLQIDSRINSWTHDTEISSKEKSKSLPPLVMTSGGLPKPLNPLFFKLTK